MKIMRFSAFFVLGAEGFKGALGAAAKTLIQPPQQILINIQVKNAG